MAKKKKSATKDKNRYATVQVSRQVKEDVKEFCTPRGITINKFFERMFYVAVSGSSPSYINEILGYKNENV